MEPGQHTVGARSGIAWSRRVASQPCQPSMFATARMPPVDSGVAFLAEACLLGWLPIEGAPSGSRGVTR